MIINIEIKSTGREVLEFAGIKNPNFNLQRDGERIAAAISEKLGVKVGFDGYSIPANRGEVLTLRFCGFKPEKSKPWECPNCHQTDTDYCLCIKGY